MKAYPKITSNTIITQNPNKKEKAALRSPSEILDEIKALDDESAEILNSLAAIL